jgi:hypothetical protein
MRSCRRGLTLLGAGLLSALGAAGCGLLSFDVGQDIPGQTVPGSPIGALLPASLFSIPMNVDIQSETAARGTGPARSAALSSLTLTTRSPGATFEFLSSIAISISASGGANLPQKEIARLQPVPATSTIAIPPTPGVDLLPYIKQGATITATASGHMPVSDVSFDGRVVITVHL